MKKGSKFAALVVSGLMISASGIASVSAQTAVERMAKEAAAQIAPALPMRINQNVTIQTVFAEGAMVMATGLFSYTKADLDAVLAQSGKTNEEALAAMRNSARGGVCIPGAPLRRFVSMGGTVRYLYRFADGTTYTVIDVSSCS